jgi:signal transduction histidine kinase
MYPNQIPIPENEFARIMALSDFDLDYTDLESNFKDLTKLAAKVAGTEVSLVNLIDTFTQWSISNYGLDLTQMPREESVCQYTIMESGSFEVRDLSADDRFRDKYYVKDGPRLKYYFGIPLKSSEGTNLGALCVLDKEPKQLTPEKIELLKIIGDEILNRLRSIKAIQDLKNSVLEIRQTHKKVAHDIRGPIGGIIGLAQIIAEQGDKNKLEEVLEFIKLIHKSGESVLDLADEILTASYNSENVKSDSDKTSSKNHPNSSEFNLHSLRGKLVDMYIPQALQKNISFEVQILGESQDVAFSKNKLLQIIGNLVSNAIKFTPESGKVKVNLNLMEEKETTTLQIEVQDNGKGISKDKIEEILSGSTCSTKGTQGEKGYGFGLELVRHLVEKMKGDFLLESTEGEGTAFTVLLPM